MCDMKFIRRKAYFQRKVRLKKSDKQVIVGGGLHPVAGWSRAYVRFENMPLLGNVGCRDENTEK